MNLLIIDDEYYTVENLRQKIASRRMFSDIFCAYNITQAQKLLDEQEIAVMLCDIEMPGGSGLELLDLLRQKKLDTVCIFLTAYAKFDYISKAMKLSSSDYLLKPVENEELFSALEKAVGQYDRQRKNLLDTLYADYWKESELSLMEQFWLDLVNRSIPPQQEQIQNELKRRKLSPSFAGVSCYLLLVQCCPDKLQYLDHSLLDFTIKNVLREYFYSPAELPVAVRISEYVYLLALPAAGRTRGQLLARCQDAFRQTAGFVCYFPFPFNFFVCSRACTMASFHDSFSPMQQELYENVALTNHVFDMASSPRDTAASMPELPLSRWRDLLLSRQKESLQADIDLWLSGQLHSGSANRSILECFYYSFLSFLLNQLGSGQSELSARLKEYLPTQKAETAFLSLEALKNAVSEMLELFFALFPSPSGKANAVTVVKDYIASHLDEEMTRESLAALVYLNPDYLSHMFKKETGSSLTSYIIDARIAEAKCLLSQGSLSIRDIAIACGFQNVSYFSKQFKKATGMTPRKWGR